MIKITDIILNLYIIYIHISGLHLNERLYTAYILATSLFLFMSAPAQPDYHQFSFILPIPYPIPPILSRKSFICTTLQQVIDVMNFFLYIKFRKMEELSATFYFYFTCYVYAAVSILCLQLAVNVTFHI